MSRRMTKEELALYRKEYEGGLTIPAIAKRYGIGASGLYWQKRKGSWKPWRPAALGRLNAVAKTESKAFRRDDRDDVSMIDRHFSEWRTIRVMLQKGVDLHDRAEVDFVQACAGVLATVQDRERELRALRTKGRLKVVALRPPPVSDDATVVPAGRYAPRLRRPERVSPSMASDIRTINDLVRVWTPNEPPGSARHRRSWLNHIEEFCAFVGHRDPRLVTRDDAFRWRDQLILSGISSRTVHMGRVAALRALFQYAVQADVIVENPFSRVVHRFDKRAFQRRGFTHMEALTILSATLQENASLRPHTQAVRRWVPWICAFTGARLGEVMQLRKSDVIEVDGIPAMVIDPAAGSVKGFLGRTVPLHPQLIDLGFLAFVKSRPEGYLFADGTGVLRRTTSAEHLAKWIRKLGITDRKAAPLHSFRHRFKTIARAAGIGREYHHAITGHREGMTRGDNYGEVPLKALYREILKLPWIQIAASAPPSEGDG